jgi:hypothetical protein
MVSGTHTPLRNATQFGTNWNVKYRLKYTPSTFGGFVEPPRMAWDEVILFNDYSKGEHWHFSGNLYTQKPDSPTMAVWAQRYFRAYLHARGQPFNDSGRQKGLSRIFDRNGTPAQGAMLGNHVAVTDQNKAVQDYLKRNGGILEIEVHDIPCLLKATMGKDKNIERILIFNCGVTGLGPRVQAWQHLRMDSSKPEAEWYYNFQMGSGAPGLKTTGLRVVPEMTPKGDLLPTGGIW